MHLTLQMRGPQDGYLTLTNSGIRLATLLSDEPVTLQRDLEGKILIQGSSFGLHLDDGGKARITKLNNNDVSQRRSPSLTLVCKVSDKVRRFDKNPKPNKLDDLIKEIQECREDQACVDGMRDGTEKDNQLQVPNKQRGSTEY